jgi:hypothetical protein
MLLSWGLEVMLRLLWIQCLDDYRISQNGTSRFEISQGPDASRVITGDTTQSCILGGKGFDMAKMLSCIPFPVPKVPTRTS